VEKNLSTWIRETRFELAVVREELLTIKLQAEQLRKEAARSFKYVLTTRP